MANKRERQSAILEIINSRLVSSQEDLRKLLLHRGWDATQATLSRDLRELRLARVPTPEGARYAVTDGTVEDSCGARRRRMDRYTRHCRRRRYDPHRMSVRCCERSCTAKAEISGRGASVASAQFMRVQRR